MWRCTPLPRPQVGGVAWPLGPSVPTLRASDYAYSFAPPLESGAYYCLVLAPGTPADAIDLLQHVLASCCAYHGQQPSAPHGPAAARGAPSADWAPEPAAAGPQAQGKADKVAAGIRDGGQLAGRAILAAAAWAAAGLHKGSHAAVARMKPADKPTEVSPLTQVRAWLAHVRVRTAMQARMWHGGGQVRHLLSGMRPVWHRRALHVPHVPGRLSPLAQTLSMCSSTWPPSDGAHARAAPRAVSWPLVHLPGTGLPRADPR